MYLSCATLLGAIGLFCLRFSSFKIVRFSSCKIVPQIIAAHQMKNLDAVMSFTGSAFLQGEIILSPLRVVMLKTVPCLPRDSPDEWIMRRSATRIVSPSRPPTSASWFQIFIFSMFKDVRANCFCASLLRTEIHIPRHASARAKYLNV